MGVGWASLADQIRTQGQQITTLGSIAQYSRARLGLEVVDLVLVVVEEVVEEEIVEVVEEYNFISVKMFSVATGVIC